MAGLLKVGLTGGIACGRTTVGRTLRRPGWRVLDADGMVHSLLGEGGEAAGPVIDAFGAGVRAPGGGVDRKVLGSLVFSDRAARRRLEGILHPLVLQAVDEEIGAFEKQVGSGIVVVDAALMVETGSYRRYHRLVVVHCPPGLQRRRLMDRDGITVEEADARLAAQAPLSEKTALADYTIDTGGSMDETKQRTLEVAGALEIDLALLPDLPARRREEGP
jgi:dephospho-CoA kinase